MTINVNGRFKLESGSKGTIIKVGTFDGNGHPINWTFSGEGEVAALEIGDNGRIVRWAGFTLKELRDAYKEYHDKR